MDKLVYVLRSLPETGRFAAWAVGFLLLTLLVPRVAGATGDVERGKNLFALAGGCGCHTSQDGPVGAGGGEAPTPFGTFYGTNITPDEETGIGSWSDEEIEAAIRRGENRDGVETPAMPYYWYSGMSDEDLADLIAYLRSLQPVHRPNRPHEGEVPLERWAYRFWRWWFAPRFEPARQSPAGGMERGRYLADHVSICGDCHTPRSRFGAPLLSMHHAGTKNGPGDKSVPNITPDATGIAEWDSADLLNLLRTGFTPEFDNVQGYMADVIEGHGGGPGYRDAREEDLRDIAEYLKTIRPIEHEVD